LYSTNQLPIKRVQKLKQLPQLGKIVRSKLHGVDFLLRVCCDGRGVMRAKYPLDNLDSRL
jgi:hypothetical protein